MTTDRMMDESTEGLDIAIIGMSGRFPGADDLDQFWRNLRDGVESIRRFTDEELKGFGVSPEALNDPNFVKAGAILENIDQFDARFFGYSPNEAAILDPQQRIFLECAWQALEDAGYSSNTQRNLVGVFTGTSLSSYLLYHLMSQEGLSEDTFQWMIGNDKDFLSTRVSYELDLRGPSLDIQTACSTSLVAVHMACQSLISCQCDLALAGGVSVQVPRLTGYYYRPGGVNSPDGHCRPYDARAQGTVFGSGVGIVVLKRLTDALADRDTIHAIIKGSALNNDGSSKIGYTAPSVDGQAQVIAMAHLIAGVSAETITYVETHGTGTVLGDPVEVAALAKAFRAASDKSNFCAIGSVKSNIGHLDAAAGVAGLIKTVLALKHKQLPASLHFEQPNPEIDFADTPFFVNSALRKWEGDGARLRAGVSSFGVGGTNAHVILEEAPKNEPSSGSRSYQLIVVSAQSESALETASRNLARSLREREQENFFDAAYTLQVGRKRMPYRKALVCRTASEAARLLELNEPRRVLSAFEEAEGRTVVFMFPGGGAQYVNMGLGLYQTEEVFRQEVDMCCELLKASAGCDPRDYLYPKSEKLEEARRRMTQPSIGLPALFAVEYAMAKQLEWWGIKAAAMIGHSLGEYVAACLAGVFSLEDALKIVRMRGVLFEESPKGVMMSVAAGEEEVSRMIDAELSIAAVNGPQQVVVSGEEGAIAALCERMARAEIECQRLHIEVAAHSHLVEGILDRYESYVRGIEKKAPARRYISNVSGAWVTAEEPTDAGYWRRQLRQCVRFSDGVKELVEAGESVMVEVGPGHSLKSLVRMRKKENRVEWVVGTMRHPQEEQDDGAYLTGALGELWMAGVEIDWSRFYQRERRGRVALPTYPFERQRHWIEPSKHPGPIRSVGKKKSGISEWIYLPLWKQTLPVAGGEADPNADQDHCSLIFADEFGLASKLAAGMTNSGYNAVIIRSGHQFKRQPDGEYVIDPRSPADYYALFEDLIAQKKKIKRIVHALSVAPKSGAHSEEEIFDRCQDRGFYSLLHLAQALTGVNLVDSVQIDVLSVDMQEVTGHEDLSPAQSTLLALCGAIPQEYPSIRCRSIDVTVPEIAGHDNLTLLKSLIAELTTKIQDTTVAYRGGRRWVQVFEDLSSAGEQKSTRRLRDRGVYLITGGLGGIGLILAEYLAREARAKIMLTGRSALPSRRLWDEWLAAHEENDPISLKIRSLQAIERLGAEVFYAQADVTDLEQMRLALAPALEAFGEINGVIHAAGITGEAAIHAISQLSVHECERQFRPKVKGLFALEKFLGRRNLDFCALFSSIASLLGGIGLSAYSAANLFMDAFSRKHNRESETPWLCIDWEAWRLAGRNEQTFSYKGNTSFGASIADLAISGEEGMKVFEHLLNTNLTGRALVSTADLNARIDQWIKLRSLERTDAVQAGVPARQRSALGTTYVEPDNKVERTVAWIWQEVLGVERVGAHDNFFDLGGNSLLGLKVISLLKRELGISAPVVALFEGPTVRTLSDLLSRKNVEPVTYDRSRSRGEERRERRLKKLRPTMEPRNG